MARLNHDNVGKLLTDPSPSVKVSTAWKVAGEFNRHDLSPGERNFAIEAFRIMSRDADVAVRRALADNLKDNPLVPHDVVRTLATDVAEVATPMLHNSVVLADEDLIEIVRTRSATHQLAIARRHAISPLLADGLAEAHNKQVAVTLLGNPGADISEATYDKLVRLNCDDPAVMSHVADHRFGVLLATISQRPRIPAKLAERLVSRVAEKLSTQLAGHRELARGGAERLVAESREKATVELLTPAVDEVQVADLVRQLRAAGRLTPSLVVRALYHGRFDFVDAALAAITGRSIDEVRQQLASRTLAAARTLAGAAGLDGSAGEALLAGLKVARETKFKGGAAGLETYQRRLVDRQAKALNDPGLRDVDSVLRRLAVDHAPRQRIWVALTDS